MENTHELLAFGFKNLRELRGLVAPYWQRRWCLLLGLLLSVIEISREAQTRWGATATIEAYLLYLPYSRWGCPMSAAVVIPMIWATEQCSLGTQPSVENARELTPFEVAFYRKYTEGLLQRYLRLSMESGKVPSLLGQEIFRGKVTSYKVGSFVDSLIFVHDVEKCIAKLDDEQQHLISRIALQQYSLGETASLMGMKPRTVVRRYGEAIDRLTRVFLSVRMLEPQKCCQGGEIDN